MAAVCVFCASSERIDPSYVELAAELGTALAARGHSLVSGGGRVSMMGSVARAVRAGGGATLGVIPEALVGLEVADDDADELVVVPDMRTRKGLMDARSDAFVALPGGLGTLEELLEVWVARSLRMHSKPVVVLDPDGTYQHLHALVDALRDKGFVRDDAVADLVWTTTVEECLDAVERLVAAPPPEGAAAVEELLESEP